MQSNLSQTQTPVYDDYSEFDSHSTHDINYEDYDYADYEYDVDDEIIDYDEGMSNEQRVVYLLLVAIVVIVIAGILIFGVVPYVESVTQGNPPPLPPAVQT